MTKKAKAGTDADKSVLILAKPGRIRDGLEALLRTIPQVKIVCQVKNSSTALEMVTELGPDLILLVTDLFDDEVRQFLQHLKDEPGTQCLVLTDTALKLEQAEAAGADEVLLTGFTTRELFESVARLLSA